VAGLRASWSRPPTLGGGMSTPFLTRLLQSCCRHNFSWPHNGSQGHDYQVCVLCGAAYEYDWSTMKRTRRIASQEERGDQALPSAQA
jgi:hypothetical protein